MSLVSQFLGQLTLAYGGVSRHHTCHGYHGDTFQTVTIIPNLLLGQTLPGGWQGGGSEPLYCRFKAGEGLFSAQTSADSGDSSMSHFLPEALVPSRTVENLSIYL